LKESWREWVKSWSVATLLFLPGNSVFDFFPMNGNVLWALDADPNFVFAEAADDNANQPADYDFLPNATT
jgi:hypothetical protein